MKRKLWAYWTLVQGGFYLMGSVVTPYLRSLGLDPGRIGLYQSVSGVAAVVGSLGGGAVGDRWGRREAILMARFLHLAGTAMLLVARRWDLLLAVAVLSGLSQMAGPAFSALVAGESQNSSRATFFGGLQTVAWLMGVGFPLLGGVIADRWGARVAMGASLPFFLAALVVASALRPSCPAGGAGGARVAPLYAEGGCRPGRGWGAWEGLWVPGMRSTVVGLMAGHLVSAVVNGVINLALPLWVQDYLGGGYTEIAGAGSAVALGSAITIFLGGKLADRYGRKKVGTFTLVWAGLGAAAFPLVKSIWHLYVLLFLICLAANAGGPAVSAMAAECVRPSVRATFSGLLQSLWWGGLAVGSALGGFLYARGLLPVWIAIVAGGAMQLLLWLTLVRETLGLEVTEPPSASGYQVASGVTEC
ncbi:MAG: MFS transporter [Bacillota bacterium]